MDANTNASPGRHNLAAHPLTHSLPLRPRRDNILVAPRRHWTTEDVPVARTGPINAFGPVEWPRWTGRRASPGSSAELAAFDHFFWWRSLGKCTEFWSIFLTKRYVLALRPLFARFTTATGP